MKSLNIRETNILDKINSCLYLQVHFYMILLPNNYFENHSTNSAQLSRIARDRSQRLRLSISLVWLQLLQMQSILQGQASVCVELQKYSLWGALVQS